jgi:hypothetical protein
MSNFVGFSDASKLYAENYQLVEAMYEHYLEEQNRFYEAMKGLVRLKLAAMNVEPDGFTEWLGKNYRTWVIPRPGADGSSFRQWVAKDDPRVIVPGIVTVHVLPPDEVAYEDRVRLVELSRQEHFANIAKLSQEKDADALFTYTIEGAPGEACERLADTVAWLAAEAELILKPAIATSPAERTKRRRKTP